MHYKRLHLRDVSFGGLKMDFEFELKNPNDVGVTFSSLAYKLDLDGNTFVQGNTRKAIELRAKGTSPIHVPLQVQFQKLARSLLPFFQKRDKVPYHLYVKFGIQTPIGELAFPFNLRGHIPVPKLPKVQMKGVHLGKLSLTGAVLAFHLIVQNRSRFPVDFKGLNYNIAISGKRVAGGRTKISPMSKGQSRLVKIPLRLQFLQLGMAVANAIRNRRIDYRFRGNLNLGLFKLPINLGGRVPLR